MASKRSFLLRLSPDLWEEIKRWADDDLRSINAQIEYILREQVRRQRKRLKDDGAGEAASGDPHRPLRPPEA